MILEYFGIQSIWLKILHGIQILWLHTSPNHQWSENQTHLHHCAWHWWRCVWFSPKMALRVMAKHGFIHAKDIVPEVLLFVQIQLCTPAAMFFLESRGLFRSPPLNNPYLFSHFLIVFFFFYYRHPSSITPVVQYSGTVIFLFPPACQLHIQHPFSDVVTILPLHMPIHCLFNFVRFFSLFLIALS